MPGSAETGSILSGSMIWVLQDEGEVRKSGVYKQGKARVGTGRALRNVATAATKTSQTRLDSAESSPCPGCAGPVATQGAFIVMSDKNSDKNESREAYVWLRWNLATSRAAQTSERYGVSYTVATPVAWRH